MIRRSEERDTEAVVGITVSAQMFTADEAAVVMQLMHAYYAGARESGHLCLVDEEAGWAIGVAYCQPTRAGEEAWDLTMIAVEPSFQGQGHGSGLLRAVEAELKSSGQRLLLVETSGTTHYAGAQAFYESHGYGLESRVRFGVADTVWSRGYGLESRIRDYYADGDDMLTYRKDLRAVS